jgi:hypothetical protein
MMTMPTPKRSKTTHRRSSHRDFALKPSRWTRHHIAALKVRYLTLSSSPPEPVLPIALLDALRGTHMSSRIWGDDNISIAVYSKQLSKKPLQSCGEAASFVENLFYYFISSGQSPSLHWTYRAGIIDMYNPSLGHTIQHNNREARWLPDATGFWEDTGIPKAVFLDLDDNKQPKWVQETACILSMAQMAVRAGQTQWTPVVLSAKGTKGSIVTATVDKKYLSDVESLPGRPLSEELEVEAQSWDLTEEHGRLAFAEAVWRSMKRDTNGSQ